MHWRSPPLLTAVQYNNERASGPSHQAKPVSQHAWHAAGTELPLHRKNRMIPRFLTKAETSSVLI